MPPFMALQFLNNYFNTVNILEHITECPLQLNRNISLYLLVICKDNEFVSIFNQQRLDHSLIHITNFRSQWFKFHLLHTSSAISPSQQIKETIVTKIKCGKHSYKYKWMVQGKREVGGVGRLGLTHIHY